MVVDSDGFVLNSNGSEDTTCQGNIFCNNAIHRKKKDGGCTFCHNILRTKVRPPGILKDMVNGGRFYTRSIALDEFE